MQGSEFADCGIEYYCIQRAKPVYRSFEDNPLSSFTILSAVE